MFLVYVKRFFVILLKFWNTSLHLDAHLLLFFFSLSQNIIFSYVISSFYSLLVKPGMNVEIFLRECEWNIEIRTLKNFKINMNWRNGWKYSTVASK
jgi:hypothetical protein